MDPTRTPGKASGVPAETARGRIHDGASTAKPAPLTVGSPEELGIADVVSVGAAVLPVMAPGREQHLARSSPGWGDRHRSIARGHDTPALVYVARDLLQAVAAGEARSLDLARDLAGAVLEESVVQRALALEELLRSGSPFALVRAVELAEALLTTSVAVRAEDGTTSGGGQ